MLYIGYPISFETACSILGYSPAIGLKELNDRLATQGIGFHFYDKNVYILGTHVPELFVAHTPISVDDALGHIIAYKKKVSDALTALGANLTEFDVEIMEDEPKRVYSPQPYAMT